MQLINCTVYTSFAYYFCAFSQPLVMTHVKCDSLFGHDLVFFFDQFPLIGFVKIREVSVSRKLRFDSRDYRLVANINQCVIDLLAADDENLLIPVLLRVKCKLIGGMKDDGALFFKVGITAQDYILSLGQELLILKRHERLATEHYGISGGIGPEHAARRNGGARGVADGCRQQRLQGA